MRVDAEYWEQGAAGLRVRRAILTDTRPYGSRGRPRALIGLRCFTAGQLDGVFVTRSRDVRAVERCRHAGFRVYGPEFLSRTPHPGSAEKDPDHTGVTWW